MRSFFSFRPADYRVTHSSAWSFSCGFETSFLFILHRRAWPSKWPSWYFASSFDGIVSRRHSWSSAFMTVRCLGNCLFLSLNMSQKYIFLNFIHIYFLANYIFRPALVHFNGLLLFLQLGLQQIDFIFHQLNFFLNAFQLLSFPWWLLLGLQKLLLLVRLLWFCHFLFFWFKLLCFRFMLRIYDYVELLFWRLWLHRQLIKRAIQSANVIILILTWFLHILFLIQFLKYAIFGTWLNLNKFQSLSFLL